MGFFTVKKKNGRQRTIVDARQTTPELLQRACPRSLGSPVSTLSVMLCGVRGLWLTSRSPPWQAGIRTTVSHNSAGSVLDDKESVGTLRKMGFDLGEIYDDIPQDFEVPDDPDMVYFAFRRMHMGWSWALWCAKKIVVHQSSLRSGLGEERFIRDKRPSPQVSPSDPAIGVYADNVNVVGMGSSSTNGVMKDIIDHFKRIGIPFEVTDVVGSSTMETLGLEFSWRGGYGRLPGR